MRHIFTPTNSSDCCIAVISMAFNLPFEKVKLLVARHLGRQQISIRDLGNLLKAIDESEPWCCTWPPPGPMKASQLVEYTFPEYAVISIIRKPWSLFAKHVIVIHKNIVHDPYADMPYLMCHYPFRDYILACIFDMISRKQVSHHYLL
jgi:hypothetical protein